MYGDIITFYDEELGADVTHRIVEKTDEGYYTKGDYNNYKDINLVKSNRIIGKVIFNSFEIGYIFVQYKYYLIFLIVFSATVLNIVFQGDMVCNQSRKIKEEY